MGVDDMQESEKNVEDKKQQETIENRDTEEPKCLLQVDLHCMGCAKKIQRSIKNLRGVEGVSIDMLNNLVIVKGAVDSLEICKKISQKMKKTAQVISPLPASDEEAKPQETVPSPPPKKCLKTVQINVRMHCQACASQLLRKILRLKGVQSAETELCSGKVTVTGTIEAERLVEYVYRHTRKIAKIIPQPEEDKQEKKKDQDMPIEDTKEDEKKNEREKGPSPPGEGEKASPPPDEDEQKEEGVGEVNKIEEKEEEARKSEVGEEKVSGEAESINVDENLNRLVHYYQPSYMMEHVPHPQLFSDENPNACCIS